jgi:GntR family transcriptional regulator / MocR family aminotransferase
VARDNDAAVVEDDYDDTDFRYGGRPIDALHSLDRAGRVVYVGSFSKTLLPSLRLGYCFAPPGLREALRRARFLADWHGGVARQLALAGCIDEAGWPPPTVLDPPPVPERIDRNGCGRASLHFACAVE